MDILMMLPSPIIQQLAVQIKRHFQLIIILMGNQSPSQPSFSPEVIVDDETFNRVQLQQLMESPHRSIVAITGKVDSGSPFFGSGVLLSKDLVLTAAHNIYNRGQKKQNTSFKVYNQPQGVGKYPHSIQKWIYLPEFQNGTEPKIELDYALMKLKKDQKIAINYSDFPKLLVTCQKCFQKTEQLVGIFGYPKYVKPPLSSNSDKPIFHENYLPLNLGEIRLFQYGFQLKRKIQLIDHQQYILKYKINTYGGQSGCPITMGKKIIGIHIAGDSKQKMNFGRLVTLEMASNILKWSKQLNGDPIKIIYNQQCCKPKVQEKAIQIKQQFIYQIFKKLQEIPAQEKQRITSLTLKATVIIQQKKGINVNIEGVISKQ